MAEAPPHAAPAVFDEAEMRAFYEELTVEQAAEILFTSNLDYVRGIIESGELATFEDMHGNRFIYRGVVEAYARYRKAVTRAGVRMLAAISDDLGLDKFDYSFVLEDEDDAEDTRT